MKRLGMELVRAWCHRGLRLSSGDGQTLASADDTNSFALLTRHAVRELGPKVVLDVGCGCGIPTVEAAQAGAPKVVGVDVLPANVALTRHNVTRAGLGDRVSAHLAEWPKVEEKQVDLVVANPPYLPSTRGLAVDGGADGTRVIRSIVEHAPSGASGLALLFGSLSNPLSVLRLLAEAGWRVGRMFAHATRFGGYTSQPESLQTLRRLRRAGTAWFCDTPPAPLGRAPHGYAVLGIVATRGKAPEGLVEAVEELLHDFSRRGPEALERARLPVAFEAGSYF